MQSWEEKKKIFKTHNRSVCYTKPQPQPQVLLPSSGDWGDISVDGAWDINKDDLAAFRDSPAFLSDDDEPITSPKKKKGKGIKKYKQAPRHAYKIQNNTYGQLMVDTDKLFNNMKLEAYKGGSLVYEQMVDRSLIDLITKRFNPKTKYSKLAKQVFHDLNILSEIPKHMSSRKYKIGKGITYYHGPDKLVDRLTILTGVRAAGNYNIEMRNEIVEILDELLKTGEIDKETYNDYSTKYYLNPV